MLLDSNQLIIQEKLRILATKLEKKLDFIWRFKNFFSKKEDLKSLYIHGGVGRGKSMLMKEFFISLKKTPKIYFHFNSFMRLLHENLRDIRKEEKKYNDELIEAIKRIVKNSKIVCFDEFQVLDIADAMLLSRIFSYLFLNKITVIFTSNLPPKELYKNGLQREIFLEFINKILLKNCEVLLLENNIDYRNSYKKNLDKRYFITNEKNIILIKEIIANLTNNQELQPKKIMVWGREMEIKKTFNNIAVIDFAEICENNFAASEYQAICQNFDLIFLLKVPQLTKEQVNETRRFMLFIDEVYENKTALIIMAKTIPQEIYKENNLQAFLRTVSRINEIKSDYYWNFSTFFLK